ncbi:hypothetical protein NDU88_004549 [Pleurodeles waltl]|uniref:Uncharacterized protein n=1 Tax=Pleurodeles waltl TaxID=8319 RepID=A0AAV7WVN6_PLEWA|nr:hypothetical protein NDU88_004549 [Pleurodeles waltl]
MARYVPLNSGPRAVPHHRRRAHFFPSAARLAAWGLEAQPGSQRRPRVSRPLRRPDQAWLLLPSIRSPARTPDPNSAQEHPWAIKTMGAGAAMLFLQARAAELQDASTYAAILATPPNVL